MRRRLSRTERRSSRKLDQTEPGYRPRSQPGADSATLSSQPAGAQARRDEVPTQTRKHASWPQPTKNPEQASAIIKALALIRLTAARNCHSSANEHEQAHVDIRRREPSLLRNQVTNGESEKLWPHSPRSDTLDDDYSPP